MTSTVSKMPGALRPAMERLEASIRAHGPMAVACSGGVDSGLLAVVAHRVLGGRMLCVLGVSPSLARDEEARAVAFFEAHALPFVRIHTREMDVAGYRANGPDRCFFCKHELFERMEAAPEARAFPVLAYGANADDRFDHRPGARAADAHRVCAPLAECGFTKQMVRDAARALGLEVWDKPASPCLASRIPYASEVTEAKLRQIDAAESVLRSHGFDVCRVRHHGELARIEVPAADIARLEARELWPVVCDALRAAGFVRVEVDPRGFKSGRMNEAIAPPS
ncbi:MAG TPA: ATP-dependent sacrificial sulfur transferase LarE [Candidatus Krumholzibacteria bacterium]